MSTRNSNRIQRFTSHQIDSLILHLIAYALGIATGLAWAISIMMEGAS